MKKRLNIITVFIAIAVGLHMYSIFVQESGIHQESFQRGYEEGSTGERSTYDVFYLNLLAKEGVQYPDSVYNEKTDSWLPARMGEISVIVPASEVRPWWEMLLLIPTTLLLSVAFIVLITNFIKIILAVNKSIIFAWVNVGRLRIMGYSFLVMYIMNLIAELYYNHLTKISIALPDYIIDGADVYKTTTLLLALIAFLIAEIFSVGLRLKEEQDLTI